MKLLKLTALPIIRIPENILERPLRVLRNIADENLKKSNGAETRQFINRKEDLINRLKLRLRNGTNFEKATNVIGRERLLISLYTEYLGKKTARPWLPDLDYVIAESILGKDGTKWHMGRRRQVALLFFTHFDFITALSYISARLSEAYSLSEYLDTEPCKTWHQHREKVFNIVGPEIISRQANGNCRLAQLMENYAIPFEGRFAEKLRLFILLDGLKKAPLGRQVPEFYEIERYKSDRLSSNFLIGSKALQIMIQRVMDEGRGKWPAGDWQKWIVRFGCDPRHGQSSATGAKWWGWATPAELQLAQTAITGLTIDFFIAFLKESLAGTDKEDQFELRSTFLLALFESQKIRNARLLLNSYAYNNLPIQYRDRFNVAKLLRTTRETSIICLHCEDDIYLIEGTHNFGLRAFHGLFPVRGFWELPENTYEDSKFRISPRLCPIFIRQTRTGKWVEKFFWEVREKFHIEWDGIRM